MGFVEIRRKGSHVRMEHSDGRRMVFPCHEEIDRITLKGALQDATVEVEDFFKHLR
jgi:predicted RNA binding protein YcfA (HicA-like mRNA interferase family)